MIYVVEIPHQRPATCWVAGDESDFCVKMAGAYQRRDDTPDEGTFAAWIDYLGSDLYALHVFVGNESARSALADNTFDGHQGGQARAALEDKLPP